MDYDVAIAGGGPAGALCAAGLARNGWRVLLADDSRPHEGPGFPEMLAPDACRLLVSLGCEETLEQGASATCSGILSFWDRDRPEFSNLALTKLHDGRMVDRPRFDASLRALAASAGVDVRLSTRLRFSGPRSAGPVRFRLESSRDSDAVDCTAAFAVEAAGRNAVSGDTGDDCAGRLYFDGLIAISVGCRGPCDSKDWLRIAPSRRGWWYKFGGSSSTCVFLTDADLLPKDADRRADELRLEWRGVNSCFGAPCEIDASITQTRDARTGCRRILWRGQWLPLGDSAFSLDPLSGSGLSRALRTANEAVPAVHEYLASGVTTALSAHAVSVSREFAASLGESRKYYGQAAGAFQESPFWERRRAAVST